MIDQKTTIESRELVAALLFDCGFGRSLYARALTAGTVSARICDMAADVAGVAGSPVGVWVRDGWATICEIAPDLLPVDPCVLGWEMWAVVDPSGTDPDAYTGGGAAV